MNLDLRPTGAGTAAAGWRVGDANEASSVGCNVGGENLRLNLMPRDIGRDAWLVVPVHDRSRNEVRSVNGEREGPTSGSDCIGMNWTHNLRDGIILAKRSYSQRDPQYRCFGDEGGFGHAASREESLYLRTPLPG